MSRNLQVGTEIFKYPNNGESGATWGEDSSDWAEALTDKVNTISSNYDILATTFTLANNQTTDASISGLLFNSSLVKTAEIFYNIVRTNRESGKLLVHYTGSTWDIVQSDVVGDAGVLFNINSNGQVQYQTTNDIAGSIKFQARVIEV